MWRDSRTSPPPSASVDLAHLRPVRGRVVGATQNTSSEPEAVGELPPSIPAAYEIVSRRDVIRSFTSHQADSTKEGNNDAASC